MSTRRRRKAPTEAPAERPRRRMPIWIGLIAVVAIAVAVGAAMWPRRIAPSASHEPAVPAAQNVLLITADTTRADYLGCYGRQDARTPNLDALAKQGTRFARCSACTPLTLPSHTTIHTGFYPFVHHVRQNVADRLNPAFTTLAETLQATGFSTHAIVASFILQGRFGLAQGFDTYSDRFRSESDNPAAAERRADEVCNEAIARLRGIAGERFFLWVHFYDPHFPYESDRHADDGSAAAYADEITFMDSQIGRLMEELRKLRLGGKTLVVFVGDHGEGLGDHGETEHGYFVYETDMHVPLIVWWPGVIPSGAVVDAQARTVDVTPTILDYAGEGTLDTMQGTSLRPLITGGARDMELTAYGESMAAHSVLGLSRLRFLCEGGWKYVHTAPPALYNVLEDPHERSNLASKEPELVERLRERMSEMLVEAPPSAGDSAETPGLSEADLQRLASLGYAAGASEGNAEGSGDAALAPSGEDPAVHVEAIETYVRAHRLMAGREFAAAEPLLREVVHALPRASDPLRELHQALRGQGRPDEIADICLEILESRPDATAARAFYAENLLQQGQREEAVAQFNAVLERDPGHVDAHRQLADFYRGGGQLEEARRHYEQALVRAPRDLGLLHGLALVLMQEERYADAVAVLRRALAIHPNASAMQRELEQAMSRLESE